MAISRKAAIRELVRHLSAVSEALSFAVPLPIGTLAVVIPARECGNDEPPQAADTPNSVDERIVAVLEKASKPMKTTLIARATGLSARGSHFRDAMARLKKMGRIFRPDQTQASYWLCGRNLA